MSYPGYPGHGYGGAAPSYPPYPNSSQQPQPQHATSSLSYPGAGIHHPPAQSNYPPYPTTPQAGGFASQSPYSVAPSHPTPYPQNCPYPPSASPYPPAPHSQSTAYPPPHHHTPVSTGPYPHANNSYPPHAYPPSSCYGAPQHVSSYPPQSNPYPTMPSAMPYAGDHSSFSSGPVRKGNPTVRPAQPFDPRADAEVLRKAMKGFGTDEKSIINVLAHRSNSQRQEIALQFKTLYGKDLVSDLKSELSGKFEDLVVALMMPHFEFMAKEVHDAIAGIGTDEETVIEVMCSASNQEIYTIKSAYQHMYNRTLEDDLRGDTSGNFKRLMTSLCVGNRSEDFNVNPAAAQADAQALLRAGELRVGTDESTFNAVLCQRSYAHLQAVMIEYQRITGHSLEKAIKKEFSGDIEEALLTILKSVENRAGYFAERLYKSMKGMGTDDRTLVRVVVSRCEVDMGDIKQAFVAKYGKTLESFITGDTSGDYKKCLLALIGA